jgi:hypothetical protein
VFVSSGFRTAFCQDEIPVEDVEKHVTSKSEEVLDEAPSGSQDASENLNVPVDEQEVKGNLQVDPDVPIRNELLDSAEEGEVDAEPKNTDVEEVPNESETEQLPDKKRSGNLDINFGK